jgi:tungstate transport system substrate-binding protein
MLIRISNGGAGATGLFQALAEDYLNTVSEPGSIEWVCNHSRNTQLALLHGHIDIALTYERDQEQLAAEEGWSKTVGCMFHDHFVLAGPSHDPAGVMKVRSLDEALVAIAAGQHEFHSRADHSATMSKERSLWHRCHLEPWKDTSATWYQRSRLSPADAIIAASKAGAYLVTDRSTLLRQTSLCTISTVTVFFEPDSSESLLMNSCYALVSTSSETSMMDERDRFIEYMTSPRGQQLIGTFEKARLGGYELFTGVSEGFARSSLRGGEPMDGKWKPHPL